jgi:hypothetical protein
VGIFVPSLCMASCAVVGLVCRVCILLMDFHISFVLVFELIPSIYFFHSSFC